MVNLLKLQLGNELLEYIPALLGGVSYLLLHLFTVKSYNLDAAPHVKLFNLLRLGLQLYDGLVQEVVVLSSEVLHIHGGVFIVDLHEVVILSHKLVHVQVYRVDLL